MTTRAAWLKSLLDKSFSCLAYPELRLFLGNPKNDSVLDIIVGDRVLRWGHGQ